MDVPLTPEKRFQVCIQELMGTLAEIINDANVKGYSGIDSSILDKVKAYIGQYNAHELIKSYIVFSLQFWSQMAQRDEQFFLSNCGAIFGFLPIDKNDQAFFSEVISKLVSSRDVNGKSYIDDDDKDFLWDSFGALNRISINFMKNDSLTVRELTMLMTIQRKKEETETGRKSPVITIDLDELEKTWI